jgi:glycosyltransferase involved in cell wall biosynthesis
MPRRWLAAHGVDATFLPHPSPQYRVADAMERFEALVEGPVATWHFYPFPHEEYLIDRLHARGHRVLVGIDDDYWHTAPWHPRGPHLESIGALEVLLGAADGLVVTTEPIRDVVRRVNPNVVVVPNAVDLEVMPPPRHTHAGLATRVGWSGWIGHGGDTAILEEAVRGLLAADERVTFVIAGEVPRWAAASPRVERDDRLLPPLVHYRRLANLDLDVFVIPLVEHPWNVARSALKALETAALDVPMIVSDVGPYRALPDDVAVKVPNTDAAWGEAMTRLIGDASLRAALSERALRWVRDCHTIDATGPLWAAALG